ncbi:MAG: carbon-nitrogen hydrolase family protein [Pseudomonadales bacterium]
MSHFAIAGVQMPIGQHNNIEAMEQRVALLMHLYPWVEMVLFSELAPFGSILEGAQSLPGPAEEAFQELARKHNIWLLPGSMFEKRDGTIFNTSSVINPSGQVVERYSKMFPFYPLEEGVSPGADFCVFDVPNVGRFGVSICYDIWFPETTRTLAAMGAEVILHPVMTTYIDRDVDLAMARAMSAANQCYVFDINGLGAGGNGQSAVFDPAGRLLHQAGSHEELIPIEVDLSQVRRQRQRGIRSLGQPLKSFRDRTVNLAVYGESWDSEYLDSLGELEKPSRENG